jgi:hypothetical protein
VREEVVMTARPLATTSCFLALLCTPACGRGSAQKAVPEVSSPPGASELADARRDFSGAYRVNGKTIEKGTMNSRPLQGTIILVQEGNSYTATYDLQTELPTPEGPSARAQVVGKGDGMVKAAGLEGSATTQIVWATVPGVDSQFAFVPKRFGPRLTSRSKARLQPDGSILIEIDSEGVGGTRYTPTHTTLRGVRINEGKMTN